MQTLRARLDEVPDHTGRPLLSALPSQAGEPLVVRVADEEPFFRQDECLALESAESLIAGVGALSLLADAPQAILAIRSDYTALTRLLSELTSDTRVEISPVAPRYPLDRATISAELRFREVLQLNDRPWIVSTQSVIDTGHRAMGMPLGPRSISLFGAVQRPGIYSVPLGTTAQDLVEQAGGPTVRGWVVLHNGWLGGRLSDGEIAVGWDTLGLVIVSTDHPWVATKRIPAQEHLARMASCCSGCAQCSQRCPVALRGGALRPHLVVRELVASYGGSPTPTAATAALQCSQCGLCTLGCPSRLDPARLVGDLAERFEDEGLLLVDTMPKTPDPKQLGRRFAMNALEQLIGAQVPESPRAIHVQSRRVAIPLKMGARQILDPLVCGGETVAQGQLIAKGIGGSVDLRSPGAGEVNTIDADLGLIMTLRP